MAKSIEVQSDYDEAGVWCLRLRKKRGKFTLDEIVEACRNYESDFYMISIKAMDEDLDQYYMVDDFNGDYVTAYRAGDFFKWREKA